MKAGILAMVAVRVHAGAVGHDGAESLTGVAALSVEAGSANINVITLIRAGLDSREAAAAAVSSTGASFADRSGMRAWLGSDEVKAKSSVEDWPTARSRPAWLRFYVREEAPARGRWSRETQHVRVRWAGEPPSQGTHVALEPLGAGGLVLSPAYEQIGEFMEALGRPRREIVDVTVSEGPGSVTIEYFGPSRVL